MTPELRGAAEERIALELAVAESADPAAPREPWSPTTISDSRTIYPRMVVSSHMPPRGAQPSRTDLSSAWSAMSHGDVSVAQSVCGWETASLPSIDAHDMIAMYAATAAVKDQRYEHFKTQVPPGGQDAIDRVRQA
jgi:hypothetical protein